MDEKIINKPMTNEEVINHLYINNGEKYNLHKASEELQELALVLTQKLLKPTKVNDQEIIDEIGDVIIRLEILKKIYPMTEITERVNFKLSKFKGYIDHKLYNKI